MLVDRSIAGFIDRISSEKIVAGGERQRQWQYGSVN